MTYVILYIIFGILFLGGVLSYWIVSHSLRNPKDIYILPEVPVKSPAK
jgi:hypothetical protein